MRRIPLLFLALALVGCTQELGGSSSVSAGSDASTTREQSVSVSLRFVLDEPETLDVLEVGQVFLNVGAVFLDPVDGVGDTAFASRQPLALTFDPASGQFELDGPELVIPEPGRYAVALLLEPGETAGAGQGKADDEALSVGIDGWYRAGSLVADEPSPLPWRPKAIDRLQVEDAWHPFAFRSTDAIRMQLAEVELDGGGRYELAVRIHIDEWMLDSVLPAVDAIVASRDDDPRPGVEPATAVVDGSLGDNVELHGLLGDMAVSARRF